MVKKALYYCLGVFCLISQISCLSGQIHGLNDNDFALAKLKEAAGSDNYWVSVHAHEFLLSLGYQKFVDSSFASLLPVYENKSPERIGLWRIGAKKSRNAQTKKVFIDKIIDSYLNSESPDRVYAAETLAKLGISFKQFPTDLVTKDKNATDLMRGFTLWGMSLPALEQEEFDEFLIAEALRTESKANREIIAYGLYCSHFEMSDAFSSELIKMSEDTSFSELARSRIKLTLLLHETELSNIFVEGIDELEQMIFHQNKKIRYESCAAMAFISDQYVVENLELIISGENVLNEKGNGADFHGDNLDCQAAAAFSILSLQQQKSVHLSMWDWLVIIFFLLIMIGIGYYYSLRANSTDDYLLGGRSMNPIMVGLSLFATLLSTLSYLAYPGEMIKYGPMVFFGILTFPVAYWIVGKFLIPKFMEFNVTSAYEILEIRLGPYARVLGTLFFLLLRFLWMSTIVFATVNTALLPIMGFSTDLVPLICLILALITVVYTVLGGLKAVVITDALQSIVLLGGALLTIVIISFQFENHLIWIPQQWLSQWEELKWTVDPNQRMTIGNIFIMTLVWQVCTAGSDQMAIQRYLSTSNVKNAKKALKVSMIYNAIVQIILGFLGLALLAYFLEFPLSLKAGTNVFDHADSLFPRFVLVGLPVGISGLVVAGIMAAAMSSLSSGLNSSSTVLSEDVLNRYFPNIFNGGGPLRKIRLISVFLGITVAICSMFVGYIEGNLVDVIIKVVNLVVGPLFVLFFMALFVPQASDIGTSLGGVISLLVAIIFSFTDIFEISVLFILPISLIVGVVMSYLMSLIYRG